MVLNAFVAISTFVAIALVAVWALRGVGEPVDARIRSLALARQRGQGVGALPFQQRVVAPFIESVGGFVSSLLPGAYVRRTERRLVLAGRVMRPSAFFAVMLGLGALTCGGYLLVTFVATDGTPNAVFVLLAAPFGTLGMYLAHFWLAAQAGARKNAMLRGLPDSMDLLTICVEAGLGLDAAFKRVAEKQHGPLPDEIARMLREVGLGKTRREALLDLAERTDLEEVRAFSNAVIQAEQLGSSIAHVLRAQSQRLRVQRRQRAEEAARKIPAKMIFPLVFFLLPSLFIFIIGPIGINAYKFLTER
jgi:tight adherence protein C